MQEGATTLPPGLHTESGFWILTGETGSVGAQHLIFNARIGTRLRRTRTHKNYVIAEIGSVPPVITFSAYFPPFASHGDSSFEDTVESFHADLKEMQLSSPGSFVLGGGDCNVQMSLIPGLVGKHTGTFERPHDKDRRDPILSLLADLGMKLPHSFSDTGPTRFSWPGQAPKQKPSKIDYIFTSTKLQTTLIQTDLPTPITSTDHRPINWADSPRTPCITNTQTQTIRRTAFTKPTPAGNTNAMGARQPHKLPGQGPPKQLQVP